MRNKNTTINLKDSEFNITVSEILYSKFKKLEVKEDSVNVALSGGNTPIPILKILCQKDLKWRRFRFFIVDERCVPNTSVQSNYGNINKVFFKNIPSEKFKVIREGKSIYECIKDYTDLIVENVPIMDSVPQFDLIILGMGEDGHIASLFPETEALSEQSQFVVCNEVKKLNSKRITFTYPLILNAKEVILLVNGDKKNKIIDRLYTSEESNYPIAKVFNEHQSLTIIKG